jgi:DNA-binding response OmpR family regulator
VVGADQSLRERFGSGTFDFDVLFPADIPSGTIFPAVFLLRFPQDRSFFRRIPRTAAIVAYGPMDAIQEAFEEGARDFVRSPIDMFELNARVRHLLVGFDNLRIPGTAIYMRGDLLTGDAGNIILGKEEALLLRTLIAAMPGRVSRVALLRYIWPGLQETSRVVDSTISRLRHHLGRVDGQADGVQIRSVRRFGYSLTINAHG